MNEKKVPKRKTAKKKVASKDKILDENKLPEEKNKGGAPVIHEITPQMIRQVETMSGLGMKSEDIAHVLGMHRSTLWLKFKEDGRLSDAMNRGKAKAAAQVTQTAYQLAVSGKNPVMTMFWLKTQQRWKETDRLEMEGNVKLTFETKIGEDGVVRRVEDKQVIDNED